MASTGIKRHKSGRISMTDRIYEFSNFELLVVGRTPYESLARVPQASKITALFSEPPEG